MKTSKSRRGGILSGLLLTGFAITLLVVAAGIYLAHNVRVHSVDRHGGEDVSIDTPVGHINIQAHDRLDPAALGIPNYPGAKRTKDGGGATFAWTSSDGKEDKALSVSGGDLYTPNPPEKVIEYYKAHLPNWMVITDRDGAVRMEYTRDGYKRILAIREKDEGTHIGVASVGEPASN
jgi:hypothetical protein